MCQHAGGSVTEVVAVAWWQHGAGRRQTMPGKNVAADGASSESDITDEAADAGGVEMEAAGC